MRPHIITAVVTLAVTVLVIAGVAGAWFGGYQVGVKSAPSLGPIEWYSLEELQWWLDRDQVSEREWEPEIYDCDNAARELVDSAARQNRVIGLLFEEGVEVNHMANFAIVGNIIYRIEAATDSITNLGWDVDRTLERRR